MTFVYSKIISIICTNSRISHYIPSNYKSISETKKNKPHKIINRNDDVNITQNPSIRTVDINLH